MKRTIYVTVQTALVLCFAAAMGMGQDSLLTLSGRVDYKSGEEPKMMLPACGSCTAAGHIDKQNVLNTVACTFPADNQILEWKCMRFVCGAPHYIYYNIEVIGWTNCTDLPEGSSNCPPDQCTGGPP